MTDHIDAKNLSELKKEMMTCTMCGFCKSVCPVFEDVGWDTGVARGRVILAYGLMQKEIPADPRSSRPYINAPRARIARGVVPRRSGWSMWSRGPGRTS